MSLSSNIQAGSSNPFAIFGAMFWVNYGLTILCYMIGVILLTALVYTLMRTYNEREERLEGITLSALRPLLMKNMGRMLKLTLFFFMLYLVTLAIIIGLVVLTPFTLIITIPLLIACGIPRVMLLRSICLKT